LREVTKLATGPAPVRTTSALESRGESLSVQASKAVIAAANTVRRLMGSLLFSVSKSFSFPWEGKSQGSMTPWIKSNSGPGGLPRAWWTV
jgi:hypothetical protein